MLHTSACRRGAGFVTLVTLLIALAATRPAAQVRPVGTIDGTVATQNGAIRLGGAQVDVRDASGTPVATLLSDGDGHFAVPDLAPGKYTVAVSLEGFVPFLVTVAVTAGHTSALPIDIAIANLTDTVTVVAPATVVSSADTISTADAISSRETDQLAPGGGLQAALRLLASVIQLPGGLSIKGGRPTQAATQIGATTLADPAVGLVHFNLPDDAIDSVAVLPNPYAVEYGRFSSGVVVIRTRRGGDTWKIRVNNFDPTFRTKRREDYNVKGISGWGPRVEFGGPIVKDRVFLEEAAQYKYSVDDVPSRPETELKTSQWFSSFTRLDAALTPAHAVTATGGVFPSVSDMASLGTFVPPDATVDLHERVMRGAVTERALWNDSLVGETSVQAYGYRTELTPQGPALMELWPDTTFGNFYNTQHRTPSTIQAIETLSGTAKGGATGLHLFKVGVDVLNNLLTATSYSRPVLVKRADGTLVRRLDFSGPSAEHVRSTDVALFAQDRMQPSPRWYAEYGVRLDRDGVLERWNATPRVGAALLLNDDGSSVLRGGYGFFYERTPSAAGAFTQFEWATDRRFAADGVTPVGAPIALPHVVDPNLRTARSSTWDVSYDYRLNPRWSVQSSLLDRTGRDELIVDPVYAVDGGELRLESEGRSHYRAWEAAAHYTNAQKADLKVSYARSIGKSDLNAFANYFDTMMTPVIEPNAYGPSATDVPHRLLARAFTMPTPGWLLVSVVDWRSGAPYSLVNDALEFVGPRNGFRLPAYFRLDVGVERRFHILKWQPWIGIRGYNVLDSFNPSDVQANIGSPNFGSLYNSEYRQLRLQLRFQR